MTVTTRHALWVILTQPTQRDRFWLKPLEWAGSGEYQHVTLSDGRQGFLKVDQ